MICDDPANQNVTPLAFDLMHSIIEMRLRLGRLTIADATNLKREDRRPLVRLARRAGFNSAALVFNLPLEVCLARNRRRPRVVPDDAIALQHELLLETLPTISREGIGTVWVLDEAQRAYDRNCVLNKAARSRTLQRLMRNEKMSHGRGSNGA